MSNAKRLKMPRIKDFRVTYEANNEEGTFSEGDTVTGSVTFTLTKDTKVKALVLKAKGDANVCFWKRDNTYSAHRRYFKVKEFLIPENAKGTALPKGAYHFKFECKIPQGDMPSSLNDKHGKIVYMLEAKMSRSWRRPTTAQAELNFVSKSLSHHGHVMTGSVDKKTGVFTKGQISMSAEINRKVCSPGDTLSVVAKICNSSSKKVKPKFSLQQKIVCHANNATNIGDNCLCNMVGETINENSEETVSCQIKIPDDVIHTLTNCEIISVEHYVKVYLDISFAFDPEVVFPLIIVPSRFTTHYPEEAMGPYPAGAAGGPSYSDFPPPAFPVGPCPAPAGPTQYAVTTNTKQNI